MKKISIKVSNNNPTSLVRLDDFVIADDLSFVSGVCSPNSTITNNGICNVSLDNGITYQSAFCDTKVVKRMGYITIDNVRHYVEDGFVSIDNTQFKATFIKNDTNTAFESAYVIVNNEMYNIQECQSNQWKLVRNVKIYNSEVTDVKVFDCECIGVQDSVIIENQSYDVFYENERPYIIYDNMAVYAEPYIDDEVKYFVHSDLTGEWIEFDNPTLGLEGKYSIKTYEKSCESGKHLHLMVNKYETEFSLFREKDLLKVTYINHTDNKEFEVEYNEDHKPYIDYYGTMYPISADMKVCVIVDGNEYPITLSGTMEGNPQMKVGYITDYPQAVISAYTDSEGIVTEVYRRLLVENGNDKYWANEKVDFVSYSGITYGNKDYYVEQLWNYNFDVEEDTDLIPSSQYIMLPNNLDVYFSIDKINQDGFMLDIYPISINGVDFNRDYDEQFEKILGSIANNIQSFAITRLCNLFGLHIDNVGEFYDYNKDTLKDTLVIKPTENGIKLSIPFERDTALNLKNEWNINELLNERLIANTNEMNDVERDVYVPTYADEEGMLHLLKSLKFNLHFRTRNLQDWSILEDNVELNNDGHSSWNCLDNYYNTHELNDNGSLIYTNDKREMYADKLVSSSDLLYFLNFSDNDVYYQKSALSKSFLRLSFFDSPIPNQQSLLWTSTIFFNEGKCYMKYINNIEDDDFIEYSKLGKDTTRRVIGVRNEIVDEENNPTFDNNKRLCMEFELENKITSNVSSEGFYLYIYKSYSNNLHPRRIYMRVDFNHAKNGKSVPMMLLKHYNEDGTTYQANCIKDVFDMRDGVPISDILSYIYIPIIVRYDTDLNKFTYRFEHLVENENENLEINLFEVKYKDESK